MKPIRILLCLLLLANYTRAQKINLILRDEYQNPIPFVSVYDDDQKVKASSDSSGSLTLSGLDHSLVSLSHVSFKTQELDLGKIENDTTITVVLDYKNQGLEEIIIASKPANKIKRDSKVYKAGFIAKRTDFYLDYTPKIKSRVTSLITLNRREPKNRYLRSITFELEKGRKLQTDNFVIEIKIYGVKLDRLIPEPLNTIPIYAQSKDLKVNNEIDIKEDILLAYDKLLISFEVPGTERNGHIIFKGGSGAETCSYYLFEDIERSWSDGFLKKECKYSVVNPGKYEGLNIGITYQFGEE